VLKGASECLLLLKQAPKARNYLKRVSVLPWNPKDAEDLEKCWLLLAASLMTVSKRIEFFFKIRIIKVLYFMNLISLKNGKFDQTIELCNKCLQYNKAIFNNN
jgi:hypothetical protein